MCRFLTKNTRIREDPRESAKMAPTVGSEGRRERAEMARFPAGGVALLPWTKQMLTVLWGQLRVLLQVIYYTFMSGKSQAQSPCGTRVQPPGSGGKSSLPPRSKQPLLLCLATLVSYSFNFRVDLPLNVVNLWWAVCLLLVYIMLTWPSFGVCITCS